MKPVIVFGAGPTAEVGLVYLRRAGRVVTGFAVHREYLPSREVLEGLPVVAFEEVDSHFPPAGHDFLAPMVHRNMNRDRARVYAAIHAKGYAMPSLIDQGATVHENVGTGDNCFVLKNNVLQPHVSIGDDVVAWSGNHIGHHSSIGDHCFLSSHVALGGQTRIGRFCFLGMNATVRDGVRLGEGTYVAMSATVTKDTEPWGFYAGTPARRVKSSEDIEL